MSQRFLLSATLALSCTFCGCMSTDMSLGIENNMRRMFNPTVEDYRDFAEESQDEWSFVGVEGRGDSPLEKDPDPWWKLNFQSNKARAIERNLGFE